MPFDFSTPPLEPDSDFFMRAGIRAALRGWQPLAESARRPPSAIAAAFRNLLRRVGIL